MSTKVNRDPSRSLLITPSASPPPRTGTHRTSDAAPPLKRQRVASESRSSSIQLATESKIDIQKEREASRVRLLDVWSNLAERYSRHLDEDDIVDIRTGEIVKDNGFWRGTKKYNFGLTLSSGDTDGNQEDDEAEEVSEDEDVDELDAFAYEDDDQLEEYLSKGLSAKEAALAGNRPTSDADDLQDFLEAEKRRREEYGSDFDEDELEPLRYRSGQEDTPASSENEDEGDPEEGNEEASEEYVPDGEQLETNSSIYESASEEVISEDELGNWEPNEASMVVLTNSHSNKQQEDDTDTSESDVEIVACIFPNKTGSLSVKEQKPPTQLQTPPLSQSSADCRSRSSSKSTPSPSSSPPPPSTSPFPSPSPPPVPSPKKAQIRRSYRRHDASEDDITRSRKRHDVPEDDDDDLPILRPSQRPPIPSLNSSLSRARSTIPEVVITTFPPKVANNSTQLKRSQGSRLPIIVKTKTRIIDSKADSSSKGPHSRKENDVPLVSKSKSTTLSRLDDTPKRQASPAKRREKSPQPREELVEPRTSKQVGISPELGSSLSTPRVESSKQNEHGVENTDGNSHKRKRVSAEHVPAESVFLQRPSRLQKVSAKTLKSKSKSKSKPAETSSLFEQYSAGSGRSRPRHVSPLANEYSSSSDERRPTHQSAYHFPSTPAFSHNPSPYISHPLTHLYPPVADPRAQQIITHAMQQLSSLLWSPSHANTQIPSFPFTPQHQRFSSASPNFMNLTPEHPHPYPFTFDPALSRATLPPSSSPEPPSSPTKPGRKSLVSQGQSRGRRVSFSVRKTSRGCSTSSSHSSSSDPEPLNRRNEQQSPHKGKGKAVSATTTLHDEGDSEEEFPRPSILALKRAQTPGPEKTSKSTPRGSSQSAGLRQISSSSIRSPTKSRIQKKKV